MHGDGIKEEDLFIFSIDQLIKQMQGREEIKHVLIAGYWIKKN